MEGGAYFVSLGVSPKGYLLQKWTGDVLNAVHIQFIVNVEGVEQKNFHLDI